MARLLLGTVWAVFTVYLLGLLARGSGADVLVDDVAAQLTWVAGAALAWVAAARVVGPQRRELFWLAVALTSFTVGNVVDRIAAARGVQLAVPSLADVGYVGFYPAAVVAVLLTARRQYRGRSAVVVLDAAIGGLTAAALVAPLLEPLFTGAGGRPPAVMIGALLYPVCDLVLIAVVVGVASVQGRRELRGWLTLLAGLACFTAADVLYALGQAGAPYGAGTALEALWPLGLALMATWAVNRPAMEHPRTEAGAQVALVVPALAIVVCVTILVLASRGLVPEEAVALATLALVASGTRTHLAFRALRRTAELRRLATTDELTGLANRRCLTEQVGRAVREGGDPAALLLLDLDAFKEVNDSLGHDVGDRLLVEVGRRLGAQLREDDVLARLGGDEFAVLLTAVDRTGAQRVADKMRAAIATPFDLEGIAVRTDVSIGIALAPEHGLAMGLLLKRADIAMYQAKRSRGGTRCYSSGDDAQGDERLRTIQELHTALEHDQLELHYQPKLNLRTGTVYGVEALVRWDHPQRGLVYPDAFLGLVEECGLMPRMTEVVLARALDQAAAWRDAGRPMTVAVNLSASSLVDVELPVRVAALLGARSLPAATLVLEITEEFLMADRERARAILVRLRQQGIRIAVDDFGTGYSSLSYLRELPVDELKLDRSFIFPMGEDARAAALVVSTIGLAHSLGLEMVAEGVEDAETLAELTRHRCDAAQGYHLSRPVPAAQLDLWLENRQAPAPVVR